jgi:hypothetical protein
MNLQTNGDEMMGSSHNELADICLVVSFGVTADLEY